MLFSALCLSWLSQPYHSQPAISSSNDCMMTSPAMAMSPLQAAISGSARRHPKTRFHRTFRRSGAASRCIPISVMNFGFKATKQPLPIRTRKRCSAASNATVA